MTQHVGIFGDSYTDNLHGHAQYPDLDRMAWWANMPGYIATSYGQSGSSLYYSWQQFLQRHSEYQRVVFIATNPLRLPKNHVAVPNTDDVHYLASLTAVEQYLKLTRLTPAQRDRAEAMRSYYSYLQDDQVDDHMASLIINDIRRIRPDAVIVSIGFFGQSRHTATTGLYTQTTMGDYADIMLRSLDPVRWEKRGRDVGDMSELALICHLTEPVNLLLGQHMANALDQGGHWAPQLPLTVEHEHEWGYYFSPRPL